MKNYKSLEAILQKVIICKNCDLCKTRKNSVPGAGNQNADIVFVGEAPGKSEDLRGKPFVGTAGKKLDEALENSGLTRDQVYITNIVKCRPPKNRIPNEKEKIMCSDYLENELSIINPKIICLMVKIPLLMISILNFVFLAILLVIQFLLKKLDQLA